MAIIGEAAQHDYFLGEMEAARLAMSSSMSAPISGFTACWWRAGRNRPALSPSNPTRAIYDQFRANLLINGVTGAIRSKPTGWRSATAQASPSGWRPPPRPASPGSTRTIRRRSNCPGGAGWTNFCRCRRQSDLHQDRHRGLMSWRALTGMAGLLRANRCISWCRSNASAERLGQVLSFLGQAGFTRQHGDRERPVLPRISELIAPVISFPRTRNQRFLSTD